MLQLTTEATRHLITMRRERGVGDGAAARLVDKGGRVGLTFAQAPSEGDVVVDGGEITLYIASEVASALERVTIDAREVDGGRRGLVIRRETDGRKGHRSN